MAVNPNEMFRELCGQSLYVNREGEPVDDMDEWAELMMADPHVAHDQLGGYEVSTVFLGMNTGLSLLYGGPPMIFETMIFAPHDSELDLTHHRYPTEEAARAGHDQALALVRDKLRLA